MNERERLIKMVAQVIHTDGLHIFTSKELAYSRAAAVLRALDAEGYLLRQRDKSGDAE